MDYPHISLDQIKNAFNSPSKRKTLTNDLSEIGQAALRASAGGSFGQEFDKIQAGKAQAAEKAQAVEFQNKQFGLKQMDLVMRQAELAAKRGDQEAKDFMDGVKMVLKGVDDPVQRAKFVHGVTSRKPNHANLWQTMHDVANEMGIAPKAEERKIPLGYEWDESGTSLRPIPGGPADKPAEVPGFDVKEEGQLRKEFASVVKPFLGIRDAYARVQASAEDPSAAGDMALIFNYMKILDPNSTVREGEYATAENAGGVGAQIYGAYNRVLNGERLAPEVRADFLDRSQRLYNRARDTYAPEVERYSSLARQYGYDPDRIVFDIARGVGVPPVLETSGPPLPEGQPTKWSEIPDDEFYKTDLSNFSAKELEAWIADSKRRMPGG